MKYLSGTNPADTPTKRRTSRRWVAGLAAFSLLGGGWLASVQATDAEALNLKITNDRRSPIAIQVCENWGTSSCTTASVKAFTFIAPGKSTRDAPHNMTDADGIFVASGWCYYGGPAMGEAGFVCADKGKSGYWWKIRGTATNRTIWAKKI